MGKASSSKKVARAARAGGKGRGGNKRNLGFPVAIVATVLVGVVLLVFAVSGRDEASAEPPQVGDHWHAAYGFYDCTSESFAPPIQDPNDPAGIHSHGDGLIHIHPFVPRAAGNNATMGEFLTAVDVDLSDDGFSGGELGEIGGDDAECDGETPIVQVGKWDDAASAGSAPPDEVFTEGIEDIRFLADGEAYTMALLPEGEDIPPPAALGNLARLDPETETLRPPAEGGTSTTVAGGTAPVQEGDGGAEEGESGAEDPGPAEGTEDDPASTETTVPSDAEDSTTSEP